MILGHSDPSLLTKKRVFLDSNIIISFLDTKNKFHNSVRRIFNNPLLKETNFYYAQPSLLELKDHWRRKRLTEAIEIRYEEGYGFFKKFSTAYNKFTEANKDKHDYLLDYQIKELRRTLEGIHNNEGIHYWNELCLDALDSEISTLETSLNSTRFIYAKLNDDDVFPIEDKSNWPKWEEADSMIENFCLASNDAAILNMTNKGLDIDAFITNDGDMLYAVANSRLNNDITPYTFLNPKKFNIN